ncbi:MAG: dUTP diphosphatase [Defluviitaleaceae bacterium]|nr:dUTP diphosphatase [Defluviitaleaceae bacterium]
MRFWVKRKDSIKEILLKHAYNRFLQTHNSAVQFLISRTDDSSDLPLPKRQSTDAAGMDLHANVHEPVVIKKGTRALIPTGVKVALPMGYEAQVRPRSGLAFKFGITVLNTPGTVDADYRGELCVLLINLGEEDYTVHRGDRIAQLVIAKVQMAEFFEADVLPETLRGEGGYGSTGVAIGK